MYAIQRNDGTHQERCPNCGKFQPDEPDGYYAFVKGEDFVSVFCDEACGRRFEMKGGKLRPGDD